VEEKTEVSERAYQVAKLYIRLVEIPDVRTDIVDRMKKEVRSGTYEVPLEALANILVSKLSFDN
jgi:anti-sigma28 factor (negative regulator of flagellin synthesis)